MTEEQKDYQTDRRNEPVFVVVRRTFHCGFCDSEVGPLWNYCPMCSQRLKFREESNGINK